MAPSLLPVMAATLVTVSLAAFEGVSVAVILPSVADDLGDAALLPWAMTAYLVTSAVSTLAAGPMIDGVGLQRSFRVAGLAFAVASAACAAAPTLPLLVAARALQGVGGGLVTAIGLSAIGIALPPELRARGYAANSLVWGGFALGGPALAALLAEAVGWQAVFLVNVPLCAVALAVGWSRFGVHNPSNAAVAGARLDGRGLALLAAFTVVAVAGLSHVDPWALLALAAAAGLGALYWRHSGRAPHPVLERRYVGRMPFSALNLAAAAPFGAGVATVSFLPVYLEGALGRSPAAASVGMTMFALGWVGGASATSRALDRTGPIPTALAGTAVALASAAAAVVVAGTEPPTWLLGATLVGVGAGIGLVSPSLLTLAQALSGAGQVGRATSAHHYVRTMGQTFVTAVMGALVVGVTRARVDDADAVDAVLAGDAAAAGAAARDALTVAFQGALAVAALVIAVGGVLLLALRRATAVDHTGGIIDGRP